MTEKMKIQKLGEDFIVVIPKEISQKLGIREGLLLEMESFNCGGEVGIRMKIKNDI